MLLHCYNPCPYFTVKENQAYWHSVMRYIVKCRDLDPSNPRVQSCLDTMAEGLSCSYLVLMVKNLTFSFCVTQCWPDVGANLVVCSSQRYVPKQNSANWKRHRRFLQLLGVKKQRVIGESQTLAFSAGLAHGKPRGTEVSHSSSQVLTTSPKSNLPLI